MASAPSSATFRLALAGLLGASVLALWLLLRPPSVPGEGSGIVQPPSDATPAFTPALTPDTEGTPGPSGAATPTPGAVASVTEAPAPTEAPTEAPTAPPQLEYTVQAGDSWNSIADAYGVDAVSLASFNGYSVEDVLPADVTLVIPQ